MVLDTNISGIDRQAVRTESVINWPEWHIAIDTHY